VIETGLVEFGTRRSSHLWVKGFTAVARNYGYDSEHNHYRANDDRWD
jgi:hypothetical protein